jgi:hypothetical protein
MPKALIVQFTPIRSCLVNLPSKWVNALLDQRKVRKECISMNNKLNRRTGPSKCHVGDNKQQQQKGILWLVW